VWRPALAGVTGFSRTFLAANGHILGGGYKYPPPSFPMSCSSQSWRTPFWSHKIHKISPLNPPKLLIFGESKEEALIYILTEAIYFPLLFAWGPLCLGFPCVPRPWFVYLISCYLLFDSIVLFLGASNSVVDACPKIVKAGSALRNPLVESELDLCGGSLYQRLGWAFVALVRPLW
jgi:hypothetical protein